MIVHGVITGIALCAYTCMCENSLLISWAASESLHHLGERTPMVRPPPSAPWTHHQSRDPWSHRLPVRCWLQTCFAGRTTDGVFNTKTRFYLLSMREREEQIGEASDYAGTELISYLARVRKKWIFRVHVTPRYQYVTHVPISIPVRYPRSQYRYVTHVPNTDTLPAFQYRYRMQLFMICYCGRDTYFYHCALQLFAENQIIPHTTKLLCYCNGECGCNYWWVQERAWWYRERKIVDSTQREPAPGGSGQWWWFCWWAGFGEVEESTQPATSDNETIAIATASTSTEKSCGKTMSISAMYGDLLSLCRLTLNLCVCKMVVAL